MADALPIKANFSGADPISLGEFQTGDTVPITNGGTGRTDGVVGGFKNKIINGNFDFWQRGASLLGLTGTPQSNYLADRWQSTSNNHTINYTQQAFAAGQTDVPGEPTYWCRNFVTAAGGAAGDYAILNQRIEDVRTFAGKTVTVSFYAKAESAKTIGVGFTQAFGSGGSTAVSTTGSPVSLTSTWQKFTRTFTLPSVSGKTIGTGSNLAFRFWLSAGSTYASEMGSNILQTITFDVARVQIEEGSAATAFEERLTAVEKALCHRFYWQTRESAAKEWLAMGVVRSGLVLIDGGPLWFPVEMRSTPTVGGLTTWVAGTPANPGEAGFYLERTGGPIGITGAFTNVTTAGLNRAQIEFQAGTSFSTVAAGDSGIMRAYNMTFDAEL